MTSGADTGRYDPFEDTGDWPFRDAPPKRPDEAVADDPGHDAAPQDVIEDTPLGSPAEAEALALEDEPPFEELLPTPVETATDEVPPEPVVPEPEAVAVPTEQVTPPVTGLEVEAAAEVVYNHLGASMRQSKTLLASDASAATCNQCDFSIQ